MSVYDHPHKTGWQMIKISHGRSSPAEYVPFPGTRDEALIYEKELRGITDSGDPLFTDKLPDFRIYYKNNSSYRGFEVCENSLRHLEDFFGSMKLRHITATMIEQYKAQRTLAKRDKREGTTATIKPRTVNIELSILSAYFDYMNKNHGTQLNKPARFRKRDTTPPLPRPLTTPELRDLINQLQGNVKTLAMLMAYNGLRRNEAFNLQAQDVDIAGGCITIRGKGNKERVAPICAAELLLALKAAKEKVKVGYLLPNPITKKPFRDIRKAIRKAAAAAGIDKHTYPHLFRHSFGTALAGANINLRIIQGLLGHTDIATTQIYTQLVDTSLKLGAEAMAQLVATVATAESK